MFHEFQDVSRFYRAIDVIDCIGRRELRGVPRFRGGGAESLVPGRLLGLLLLDGNFCWISVITNEFRTLLLWVCLLFVHTFYPSGQVSSFKKTVESWWESLGCTTLSTLGIVIGNGNSNHFLGIVPEVVDIAQVVVPKVSRIIQQLLGFNIKPRNNHKP
jgi:hypothetical protein